MSYVQPLLRPLLGRDQLDRRVLVAVELFDPVAQELVTSRVIIKAQGLLGEPIRSWSGRFVWLVENDVWPTAISVEPVGLPFAPRTIVPPVPPSFPSATATERLVRIVLQPTAAYDFADVTAVRGRMFESALPASPPVTNGRTQLAWFDLHSSTWVPAAPALPHAPVTDAKGQFAAFLRLQKIGLQEPDLTKGMVKARLQITRGEFLAETRVTPDDFPFVGDPTQAGRLPEGQLLATHLTLTWADLLPL